MSGLLSDQDGGVPLTISPVLEASGLVLRPWRDDDAPAVQADFDVTDIQF